MTDLEQLREKLLHREDAQVIRRDGFAILFDCDGNSVHCFADSWTDEQIMTALDFANKAFDMGIERGKMEKVNEIRSALGL